MAPTMRNRTLKQALNDMREHYPAPVRSPFRTWVSTHLFRTWTALVTLAGFGWAFFYKPEWVTWWLRTTMTGIEQGAGFLPRPYGDQLEVVLRGIGGSFWVQITLAIIIVRIFFWLIGQLFKRRPRQPDLDTIYRESVRRNEPPPPRY
jgi:hypothetical protein